MGATTSRPGSSAAPSASSWSSPTARRRPRWGRGAASPSSDCPSRRSWGSGVREENNRMLATLCLSRLKPGSGFHCSGCRRGLQNSCRYLIFYLIWCIVQRYNLSVRFLVHLLNKVCLWSALYQRYPQIVIFFFFSAPWAGTFLWKLKATLT